MEVVSKALRGIFLSVVLAKNDGALWYLPKFAIIRIAANKQLLKADNAAVITTILIICAAKWSPTLSNTSTNGLTLAFSFCHGYKHNIATKVPT